MKAIATFATVFAALSAAPIAYGQTSVLPSSNPAASPAAVSRKPTLDGAKPIEDLVPTANIAPTKPPAAATTAATPAKAAAPATTTVTPAAMSPAAVAAPAGVAATPTIVVVTQPAASAPPPANNWGAGLLGLIVLGVGGYFGLRYAQKRGMTVADSLQKLGVEMPQNGVNGPATISHLKPPAPQAASLPPLPSLSNLPEAAPAVAGAVGTVSSAPIKRQGVGNLIGTLGPVEGKQLSVPANAPLTMGRDTDNTLPMPDDTTVSRRHARIEAATDGNGFQIVDEGSSNGTYVNGQRLPTGKTRTLVVGDEIQIGASRLRFEG